MILGERIPQDFYKLFRTQNMDRFMRVLVAVYEENSEYYTSFGLTENECRAVIEEELAKQETAWIVEVEEDSEEMTVNINASFILNRLIAWGWIRSDYDEKLNANVVSFPEYSQLYVELFRRLLKEDDSLERESILSIYSALYTYESDTEKNEEMLRSALQKSRGLSQLLTNMQDGMRTYFDELSGQREFLGIQEVLISEMNNKESRKYAILTTTDSFYRYKEAVKELISRILEENEGKKAEEAKAFREMEKEELSLRRMQKRLGRYEKASRLVCQIEREFDLIERKYNKLIEQKTVFAGRAAARIRYILREGSGEQDNTVILVNLLQKSKKREQLIQELAGRMQISAPFKGITEGSLYSRRERTENVFQPEAAKERSIEEPEEMEAFVPAPLYTKRQIREFMKRSQKEGVFTADQESVKSVEDLEQLLLVWQSVTAEQEGAYTVELGEEVETSLGFTFTKLKLTEGKDKSRI